MDKPLRVLSLGWGVQSWTLAAMAALGEIEPIDFAIHSDTRHEASGTYAHAEKLRRGVRSLELNSDRQATAILRIEEVCQRNGLEFFRPVNDRECALYISKAGMGMNETNYSRFIPCYAS